MEARDHMALVYSNGVVDPTSVPCPVCGRKRREACRNSRGITLWGRPHRTRKKLAQTGLQNQKEE